MPGFSGDLPALPVIGNGSDFPRLIRHLPVTSWGARSVEACITDDRDADFAFGQFLWTGFDYIGEPTPYHTKNSYLS